MLLSLVAATAAAAAGPAAPTPAPEPAPAPAPAAEPVGSPDGLDAAQRLQRQVERVDELLQQWQFEPARRLAERLLHEHPDLPAVQLAAAWVKFHLGQHAAAAALAERAAAALGGRLERDPRLARIRSMARMTRGFIQRAGPDGQVLVQLRPGLDEVLVPELIEVVRRTVAVVGEDLDHQPQLPIVVQVLPDAAALAAATGLTEDEIGTSGTIAVCKFGRLMVTSPRSTLKGYSYLDTASHELVHRIISEKTRNRTPIWLHEALAKYEDSRWRAGEPLYRPGLAPLRQSRLARALAAGTLIPFEQMHPSMALLPSRQAAELAFSEVYTVTAFLLERRGYPGIRRLLELLAAGASDLEAIERVYGLDRQRFAAAWRSWLAGRDLVRLEGDVDLLDEPEPTERQAAGERRLARAQRVDLRDHYHLGELLRARNRPRAALVEYQRARDRAGPHHAAGWVIADALGKVLAAVGRAEQARAAFEQSLAIHPAGLEAHLALGRLLAAGQPWRAYLHLRQAVRQNPLDPRVRRALVRVCAALAEAGDQRADFAALAERHRTAWRMIRRHHRAPAQPDAPAARQRPAPVEADGARLRIASRPWARVWLDFVDTGLTTPVYALEVAPGRHVVALEADCRDAPAVIWVRVEPGETAVIDRELCPPEAAGGAPPGRTAADRSTPATAEVDGG